MTSPLTRSATSVVEEPDHGRDVAGLPNPLHRVNLQPRPHPHPHLEVAGLAACTCLLVAMGLAGGPVGSAGGRRWWAVMVASGAGRESGEISRSPGLTASARPSGCTGGGPSRSITFDPSLQTFLRRRQHRPPLAVGRFLQRRAGDGGFRDREDVRETAWG